MRTETATKQCIYGIEKLYKNIHNRILKNNFVDVLRAPKS